MPCRSQSQDSDANDYDNQKDDNYGIEEHLSDTNENYSEQGGPVAPVDKSCVVEDIDGEDQADSYEESSLTDGDDQV